MMITEPPSISEIAMALIQTTRIPLADVRRRALIESVRRASDSCEVLDMLLDSASTSPYLSSDQKQELANAFLNRDMNAVSAAADSSLQTTTDGTITPLTGMLEMVRLILSQSRKLLVLPSERRRQISMAVLHQANTEDQILDLVLQQLPTALSLDRHERQVVANDILDHRYYRLLLPDRFDCAEPLPRIGSSNDTIQCSGRECPICLEELEPTRSQVLQCCAQRFCSNCVAGWWGTAQQSVECPLCRRSLPPPMMPPADTVASSTTTTTSSAPFRRRMSLFRRRRATGNE